MLIVYYKVRPGESLPTVAAQFGVSPSGLASYNGLDPVALDLTPGRVLRIPRPSQAPTADALPVETALPAPKEPVRAKHVPGAALRNLPHSGTVALTIELSLGARARVVEEAAELLQRRGVLCTWLVTGTWARANRALAHKLHKLGHQVENHGYDHASLRGRGQPRAAADIRRAATVIRSVTGATPRWLRPPYGEVDRDVLRAAAATGHRVVLWSVDSLDWHRFGVRTSAAHLLAAGLDRAIVSLHANADQFGAVLRWVLEAIADQRLRPVTLAQVLPRDRIEAPVSGP